LHWLSSVTDGPVREFGSISMTPTQSRHIFIFVVTTPVSEEILYRGLLVGWLRRVGCRRCILLVGSLIFGANHVIPLGLAFALVMVAVGSIWFALRLRYGSLSPAWLSYFLFNAQPFFDPSADHLARARFPFRLSFSREVLCFVMAQRVREQPTPIS
jgi:CAAX protease family protein